MKRLLCFLLLSGSLWAAPPLKVDVMFVGAHPDDDSMATATLSMFAPRAAVISATRGEGGGNAVGLESGRALGVVREAEQRAALGKLGIPHVFYLDRQDFGFTTSATAAERDWGHDEPLERLVGYIRTMQPDVVITMQPYFGHGHHQYAARLATEAFMKASDPSVFARQIEDEGLKPWQPRKLLYVAEDGQADFELAAEVATLEREARALREYRSQGWDTQPPAQASSEGFVCAFDLVGGELHHRPGAGLRTVLSGQRLVAGKPFPFQLEKVVWDVAPAGEPALDLPDGWTFDGKQVIPRGEPGVYTIKARWGEAETLRVVRIEPGQRLCVQSSDIEDWASSCGLQSLLPRARPSYVVALGEAVNVAVELGDHIQVLSYEGTRLGLQQIEPYGLKASLAVVPNAEMPVEEVVDHTRRWEGRVDSDCDLSARFGMRFQGENLELWCDVSDDIVVSNLIAEDNRGHWRTDSVELAFESEGAVVKVGIVPFNLDGEPMAARDADSNPGPVAHTLPNLRLISERTTEGYRIEASVPWRDLGLQPGRPFGFNLMLYDADKANAAPGENANVGRIAWSAWPAVQGTPRLWGRVR